MKITNKNNLPEPMVNFITQRGFEPKENTIRVTHLLQGIREVWLSRRHYDEIVVDVSDMIWAMFGTALHKILEESEEKSYQIKEARLSEKVGGLTLSGAFDLYDGKTKQVVDYKTCSVWKVIFGDIENWKQQIYVYSWLLIKAGFEVKGGKVIALMKDHSIGKARREASYPPHPVQVFSFAYTEKEHTETEKFIREKMLEFERYKETPDDELPVCTEEERWYSGTKYAVKKGKNKTALRVLDSMEEAEQWMQDNEQRGGTHVEVRIGENRKCLDYCSAREFCSFYKSLVEKENENE